MIAILLAAAALQAGNGVSAAAPAPAPTIVRVKRDTPVELMAVNEVSTASVTPGTVFKLRLNRAIAIDGRTVIPVGTPAFGEVTAAQGAGALGHAGTMSARLVRIQFGDASIPIEGQIGEQGTGAGSAGVAILFTGVVGLFHRGNNAKIKAGEIVAGFVSDDVALDLSGPHPRAATVP